MRRRFSVCTITVLCLLIAISLSACSSPAPSPSGSPDPGTTPTEKYKIYLDLSYSGNAWSNEAANLVETLSKTPPYDELIDFTKIISGADVQKQISDLQSMIAEGADAIIFYPLNPSAYTAVLDQAQAQGTLVFAYDSTIVHPWVYNVSSITTGIGQNTAQYLANALGGKGNIFMNTGVAGTAVDTLRTEGAMRVFRQYPDIHIITSYVSNWDAVESKANTLKALAAYPDVDGIWSQDGEWGVLQAVQQEGKIIPIVGQGSNGFRNALVSLRDQGFVGASGGADPTVGAFAFKLAAALLTGEIKEGDIPHNVEYPLPWVTGDNVKITEGPSLADGSNAVSLDKAPATFVCDSYNAVFVPEVDLESALNATPVPGMTIQPIPLDKIKEMLVMPGVNAPDDAVESPELYDVNPDLVQPIPVP